MVAILPMLSCRTESSRAAVADAVASPTPTPEIEIVSSAMRVHFEGEVFTLQHSS